MSRRVSEGDDIDRFELALDGYAHPDCHPVAYGREYRCRDEGLLHNFEGITATN